MYHALVSGADASHVNVIRRRCGIAIYSRLLSLPPCMKSAVPRHCAYTCCAHVRSRFFHENTYRVRAADANSVDDRVVAVVRLFCFRVFL